MIGRAQKGRWTIGSMAIAALACAPLVALARGGPGGGPPGGGPGGPPGGFGPPPGGFGPPPGTMSGPMGPMFRPSVVNTPATLLARGLKLTPAQRTRVEAFQRQFVDGVRASVPPPRPGIPPTFDQMRAVGARIQKIEKATASKIEAVLTADQKRALPGLLREVDDCRTVSLPGDATTSLNLTAAQRKKIAAIAAETRKAVGATSASRKQPMQAFQAMVDARRTAQSRALAVLTPAQRKAAQNLMPRFGPGGPPGPGGPRGFGGPGGPGGPGGGPPGRPPGGPR